MKLKNVIYHLGFVTNGNQSQCHHISFKFSPQRVGLLDVAPVRKEPVMLQIRADQSRLSKAYAIARYAWLALI